MASPGRGRSPPCAVGPEPVAGMPCRTHGARRPGAVPPWTAMTERKPPGMSFETWVERQIAQAHGARRRSTTCRARASRCPRRSRRRRGLRVGGRQGPQGEHRPLRHAPARAGAAEGARGPARARGAVCRPRPRCAPWRRTTTPACEAFWRRPQESRWSPVPGLADVEALVAEWRRTRPPRRFRSAPPPPARRRGSTGGGLPARMTGCVSCWRWTWRPAARGGGPRRGARPDPALLGRRDEADAAARAGSGRTSPTATTRSSGRGGSRTEQSRRDGPVRTRSRGRRPAPGRGGRAWPAGARRGSSRSSPRAPGRPRSPRSSGPRASSVNTSSSRGVSARSGSGTPDPGGGRRTQSSISRRVSAGSSSAEPSATVRTACSSADRGESLSRKPLAPARRAA